MIATSRNGNLANDGDDERQDQDQDLGDEEHLDVQEEGWRDPREPLLGHPEQ